MVTDDSETASTGDAAEITAPALTIEAKPSLITRKDYDNSLELFDIAVCNAMAVSQASSNRIAVPHHGHGTHIFTCICSAC